MSEADTRAARAASNYQLAWFEMVELCTSAQNTANWNKVLESLAQACGKSLKSMETKANAILFLLRDNSAEAVKALGEEATLKRFQEQRRAQHPEKEEWSLKLPKSAKIALLARLDRIGALHGTRSRESQVDWLCGHIDNLSDEEIKS